MARPPAADVPGNILLWTFDDQTAIGHAMVVLVGAAVWFGVYLFSLDAAGGLSLATEGTSEAIRARRDAVQIASISCWVWFSGAFVAGKGGPALNVLVYPIILLVTGSIVVALALFGGWPDGALTAAPIPSATFLVDVIYMFMPGYVISLVLVGSFSLYLFWTDKTDAWVAKHVPQYHEIELTEDSE